MPRPSILSTHSYHFSHLSDPATFFDNVHQKLNDLATEQRIHHATAKLRALTDGFEIDFPRQHDAPSYSSIEADASPEHSTSPSHQSTTPDEHLTSQQKYFRQYWRGLPSESPRSLSPTPPPQQLRSLPVWQPVSRKRASGTKSSISQARTRQRKVQRNRRVQKPKQERHPMVTRSRATPSQRYQILRYTGRPP